MMTVAMTPAAQVAAVLAAVGPGEMPDMPEFLRVDAAEQARRNEWNKAHPIQGGGNAWTGGSGKLDADKRPEAIEFMKRQAAEQRARETGRPVKEVRHNEPRDMTGFRWDPRRGRFIPDGYTPPRKASAPITDEERKLTEALHKANAERAAKAPKKRAKASTAQSKAPAAPRPLPVIEGETKHAMLVRLLKRPEGCTLQEAAEVTGWQPHSVQARIGADLKKKMGLHINRVEEEGRGNVYRIDE